VNESDEQISSAPVVIDVLDPTKNEIMISRLQPNTVYQVQVAAFTSQGLGEFTKTKKIRTKGAGTFYFSAPNVFLNEFLFGGNE